MIYSEIAQSFNLVDYHVQCQAVTQSVMAASSRTILMTLLVKIEMPFAGAKISNSFVLFTGQFFRVVFEFLHLTCYVSRNKLLVSTNLAIVTYV